jgi:hypothetical protein
VSTPSTDSGRRLEIQDLHVTVKTDHEDKEILK